MIHIGKSIEAVLGVSLQRGRLSCLSEMEDSSARVLEIEKTLEMECGQDRHIPFYHGTFEQAKQQVKERKALLVACFLPHCHPAASLMRRQVLADPDAARELDHDRIVFWISNPALHFSQESIVYLAYAERQRLCVLKKIEGVLTAAILVRETLATLASLRDHYETLEERSAVQRLRDEQDAAYQRSLRLDAAKARERAAEEERLRRQQQQELEAQEHHQRLLRERQEQIALLKLQLSPEPAPTTSGAFLLSVQLPNGNRIQRRFKATDPISTLYNWVYVHVGNDLEYRHEDLLIRTMLPPLLFANSPTATLTELGIDAPMKLIVEMREPQNTN